MIKCKTKKCKINTKQKKMERKVTVDFLFSVDSLMSASENHRSCSSPVDSTSREQFLSCTFSPLIKLPPCFKNTPKVSM